MVPLNPTLLAAKERLPMNQNSVRGKSRLLSAMAIIALSLAAHAQEPGPAPSLSAEESPALLEQAVISQPQRNSIQECDKQYKSKHYDEALRDCRQVLNNLSADADGANVAAARYRVALVLNAMNQPQEALTELRQSQEEAQQSGAWKEALYALNRQGTILQKTGNPRSAAAAYTEAIQLQDRLPDSPTLVHARSNRGAALFELGDYSGALEDLEMAVRDYENLQHTAGLTSAHINLGLIHQALGDYRFAEDEFSQSLDIARNVSADKRRTAEALHNLGYLAGMRGDHASAQNFYSDALTNYAAREPGRTTTMNNLGVTLGERGDYVAAERTLNQALSSARTNEQRAVEGRTLDSLATVQAYQGKNQAALGNYQLALVIEQETGDREGQRMTLANIGEQLRNRGELELATVFYKRSVNVTETIRSDLKTLTRTQQSMYARTVADTYRELSALLLQQGRVLEAQRVIDLLQLQELDDYLGTLRGNDDSQGVPQTVAEQELFEEYDSLAARAVKIGQELNALREIPPAERTPEQQRRMDRLDALQKRLNEEFAAFITSDEVQQAAARLKDQIGDEAIELATLKKIGNKLSDLDHSAVVLFPLVLDDRLELVLATPESRPIHKSVAVTRNELRATVLAFREALLDPALDPKPPAQQLYNWIIAPLASQLEELQTIAILYAPEDALRYVPLAAFHDGKNWLIDRFRINNWTSSSTMDLASSISGDLKIVGGAYTTGEYSFEIANQQFTFSGLPFAGEEMETLAARFEGTLSFPGEKFVFDDIYRERANFNVLHLATHAAAVVGQPSDSFILFGDGVRKSIRDIQALDFDLDLAVLSACETAVGDTLSNGVEVLGLGYAMQQSGARSTIASLWSVSDGGTHALMSEFYRQLQNGKSRAESLQLAQRLLISNDRVAIASANRGVVIAGEIESKLSHPFYWAPFIIVGSGL